MDPDDCVSNAITLPCVFRGITMCPAACCHFLGWLMLPDLSRNVFCAASAWLVLHIAVTLVSDFWFLEGCIARMTELRTWKCAWIRREKNRSSLKRPLLIGPLRKSEQEKSGHDSGSDGRKQALKSKYTHRSRWHTSVSKTKNLN